MKEETELEQLRAWKESAMTVFDRLNLQEVGEALGLRLVADISPAILPGIRALNARVAQLEAALTTIASDDHCSRWSYPANHCPTCIAKSVLASGKT